MLYKILVICGFILIPLGILGDNLFIGLLGLVSMLSSPIALEYFKRNHSISIEEKINKVLNEENTLEPNKKYISKDLNQMIAVDEEKQKVCFIDNIGKEIDENKEIYEGAIFKSKVYDYRDILEVEIIQDGSTITKTSRGSQLGGALLGGILAGGVGAIIGGLSGSSYSEEEVETLCLKIITNDTETPVRVVYFIKELLGVETYEDKFKENNKELRYWHSLLKVYINKADEEDENNNNTITTSQSVPDEIKKFGQLLNDGLITQEEYNAKKKQLLDN